MEVNCFSPQVIDCISPQSLLFPLLSLTGALEFVLFIADLVVIWISQKITSFGKILALQVSLVCSYTFLIIFCCCWCLRVLVLKLHQICRWVKNLVVVYLHVVPLRKVEWKQLRQEPWPHCQLYIWQWPYNYIILTCCGLYYWL